MLQLSTNEMSQYSVNQHSTQTTIKSIALKQNIKQQIWKIRVDDR
jgi:Spy/CpxP family protein refolding chaperone